MKKCHRTAETLIEDYEQLSKHRSIPLLDLHVLDNAGEAFQIAYSGGVVRLKAESVNAQSFGISCVRTAVAAGHLAEHIGEHRPAYPLRPLWIGCSRDVRLTHRVGLNVPEFFQHADFERTAEGFCRRMAELGYNAVMFGTRDGMFSTNAPERAMEIRQALSLFQEHGLKVILKPNLYMVPSQKGGAPRCPMHPQFRENVGMALGELLESAPMDYLFWEGIFLYSDYRQHPSAQDATEADLVKEEVKMLEAVADGGPSLIYYVPGADAFRANQHAKWMPSLCDEMSEGTILAFSSVVGELWNDHHADHPFWSALRESPDSSSTPLLPVVNIGSVRQGEGLWPSPALDLIDRFYPRCRRHKFAGVLGLVNRLPARGGLLDSGLWAASQFLWRCENPTMALETWFAANRPDMDYGSYREALKKCREIVLELSFVRTLTREQNRDVLSSEESRILAENILGCLKQLHLLFEREERKKFKKNDRPSLSDYFGFFARDARRSLLHFLQCFNIPAFNFFQSEDVQESFWTQAQQGGAGQGLRGGAKVVFLEEPLPGAPGTRMQMIYQENRLF